MYFEVQREQQVLSENYVSIITHLQRRLLVPMGGSSSDAVMGEKPFYRSCLFFCKAPIFGDASSQNVG